MDQNVFSIYPQEIFVIALFGKARKSWRSSKTGFDLTVFISKLVLFPKTLKRGERKNKKANQSI